MGLLETQRPGETLGRSDERLRKWRPRGLGPYRFLQFLPQAWRALEGFVSLFFCSFARVQIHIRTQQPSLDREF